MTREELQQALREAATWTIPTCARELIIRLVGEIYRLRFKAQRQRDRIAALENPHSVGVPAPAKPEAPEELAPESEELPFLPSGALNA
jgi:hypothetical protein